MEIVTAFGLGLALAVDASVTAFSCGLSAKKHAPACPLKLAVVTGFFQGAMPLLGFFLAESVVRYVETWAHWIAGGVFLALGMTFIRNALRGNDEPNACECKRCALQTWKGIFAIGVATSIDALAVGVGIACDNAAETQQNALGETIFVPVTIFAGITFVCVYAAFGASYFFRRFPTKILGVIAGLILLALGLRSVFSA